MASCFPFLALAAAALRPLPPLPFAIASVFSLSNSSGTGYCCCAAAGVCGTAGHPWRDPDVAKYAAVRAKATLGAQMGGIKDRWPVACAVEEEEGMFSE